MSIARMTGVWSESKSGSTGLLVLLALADFADDDGFCWPTLKTVAKKARISRRQVFRIVQALQEKQELLVLPRTGPRSNCYVVVIGNSRSSIDRSLIRAEKFGVGENVLESVRDNLTDGHIRVLRRTDQDDPDESDALYHTWNNIKQRCLNEKNSSYPHYGGKGITVCQRWLNSFEAFAEDMGPRPTPNHSIDRIDPKRHYEPDNCRWLSLDKNRKRAKRRRKKKSGANMATVEPQAVGAMDDISTTDGGAIGVTKLVTPTAHDPSGDPSEELDPPESAAEAAPEKADGWLAESRIKGESQLDSMTPEERAEVGAPGGSTDLNPTTPPGDPPWAAKWRELLRPRYKFGLSMDHVIPWVSRFADEVHADVPIPTDRGGAADWHGGAMAFFRHVALDLAGHAGYGDHEVDGLARRAGWCLDLFFWRRDQGHSYYQHEVTRPASLSNKTVVALARDLRKMQDQFGLNLAVMPTEDKIKRFYNTKGEKDSYDQRQLTEEDRARIKRAIVRGEGVREPALDLLGQRSGQETGAQHGPVNPG